MAMLDAQRKAAKKLAKGTAMPSKSGVDTTTSKLTEGKTQSKAKRASKATFDTRRLKENRKNERASKRP